MGDDHGPVEIWETLSCYDGCVGVGASRSYVATYLVYFEDQVMWTTSFADHVRAGLEELGATADGDVLLTPTPTGACTRLGEGAGAAVVVEYHSLRLLQLEVQRLDVTTSGPGLPVLGAVVRDALEPQMLWAPSTLLPDFLRWAASSLQARTTRQRESA